MDSGGHQHAVLETDLMEQEKVEKAWQVAGILCLMPLPIC